MNSKVWFSVLIVSILVACVLVLPLGIAPNTVGPNYKNITVRTNVNITNSKPEVFNVTFQDASNTSLRNMTLTAGSLKTVYCNGTLRDWNGFGDITYVNATIWHAATSNYTFSPNSNNNYVNSSCVMNESTSTYVGWYVCAFDVYYYANNGTWICNMTAMDTNNVSGKGLGNSTFYPVYALNVTDGIDYGNFAVEDFTGEQTANVTNLGNMNINVTVEGYGSTKGDGLAMNCTVSGNITVENERFSSSSIAWDSKIPLNRTPKLIPGLTMMKQNDTNLVINSTYWQLYINSTNSPGGNCTGYIIFTAVAS